MTSVITGENDSEYRVTIQPSQLRIWPDVVIQDSCCDTICKDIFKEIFLIDWRILREVTSVYDWSLSPLHEDLCQRSSECHPLWRAEAPRGPFGR